MKMNWFRLIAPGLLMAATGVGAGDLMTGTLAGAELGTTVLWAALAGAFLKFVLSEGVARWQLATGTTLLEGWNDKLGAWIRWPFLIYLSLFTVIVGRALANACGVAGTAIAAISGRSWPVVTPGTRVSGASCAASSRPRATEPARSSEASSVLAATSFSPISARGDSADQYGSGIRGHSLRNAPAFAFRKAGSCSSAST